MKETIKIELSGEELGSLLLNYYRRFFNDEKIKLVHSYTSRDFTGKVSESKLENFISIKIVSNPKIGNFNSEKTLSLSGQDIRKILSIELNNSGHKIDFLSFDMIDGKLKSVIFGTNKKYNVEKLEKKAKTKSKRKGVK